MFFWVIDLIAFNYHQNNLFHGDIKPENIFFDDDDYGSSSFMTTDIGSLLYLGERNDNE
jgi:serine/threonine protein kinase